MKLFSKWLAGTLVALCMCPAFAQQPDTTARPAMTSAVAPTPADTRLAGFDQRRRLRERSLVRNVPLRNVGPTIMSGRVVDVAVNPQRPTEFYVAYASGGLWKTTDNGLSFEPLFDQQAVMTIGDVAVRWERGEDVIWLGTGENNSSRSSYAGTGIYKSTDGGRTWQHLGLAETHHTGRIVLHPDDPQTAWVAAMGHLYSSNPERGVYKTTDGGQTWHKTLFADDTTGVIDLVQDSTDPDVLYASTWERTRRAWNFVEAGDGSAIWKSTDAGESWTRLTTSGSGFPSGENVGRIGLAIYPGNEELLYALVDNQNRRPEQEQADQPALSRDMIRDMSRAEFLEVGEEALEAYLRRNGFPASYTAQSVLEMVESGEIEPTALIEYLENANEQLFDTPVIGAQVYRSEDGGQTWTKTHENYLNDLFYSYGYYFGEIRVSPRDPDRLYVMGVPILSSGDGGETFESIGTDNVHVDHHALWVNPFRSGHLVNGNDGGVNITYNGGETWRKANRPPVSQFYTVQVDQAKPYNVYGGMQDNGVWAGPHTYEQSDRWRAEGDYPYDRLMGGDGMQVAVDTRTNNLVYTGFQFGNYFRINKDTGERTSIVPEHELGERPYRFNWQAPLHLSKHNQDALYLGSQKVHRSLDRGETWTAISDDLTQGGRPGDVPYGTLTTLDESPLRFGMIWTGSDDGLVHVSPDGGYSWQDVTGELPDDYWIHQIEASHHEADRAYAALNGYHWDHFRALLYRTDDKGRTWQRIGKSLPPEPVNVVLEDPSNEYILYVGTDHGLYASLDGGESFMAFSEGLPAAPVHDLAVQQREKDLVVGTHGRSIFVADLEEIQQLPVIMDQPLHLFALENLSYDPDWGERPYQWGAINRPTLRIPYFSADSGEVAIRIEAEDGTELRQFADSASQGLNYATYDLSADAAIARQKREQVAEREEDRPPEWEVSDDGIVYLPPGTYTVEIRRGEHGARRTFRVRPADEQAGGALPVPEEEAEFDSY